MEKKKNNSWKTILFFIIGVVLVALLVYWVMSNNNRSKEVSYTEFQQMVTNGEVAEIDVYGYTVRIRTIDGVAENRFPDEVDAYCSFMSVDQLTSFITEYNNSLYVDVNGDGIIDENDEVNGNLTLKDGAVLIKASYSYESASWISNVLPFLNIVIVVIIGIFLFKAMSGNSKGFGFGKSKARLVVSSNVKFSDVAGAEEEKQELKEIVDENT